MVYQIFRILAFLVFKIVFRCEIVGLEKLPNEGPIIIAPNHKSNLDPILVSALIRPQIHWMAKKELYENKFLAFFIDLFGAFPVDRHANDIHAIKTAMKILKNNQILGIFPEGTRVKEANPKNAKSGVALLAHRTKSIIIPAYIEGNYKLFSKMKLYLRDPIDLSNLGKLGTKDYEEISENMIEVIYGEDDKNKSISS